MGIKKKILRHSAIYSVANALGKLASFFMLPFYAHIFEAEGYGIIALVDASIGILAVAFSNGSYNAILAIYHEEAPDRKSLAISTGIWTVWVLSLLCVPLPTLGAPWISLFLFDDINYWSTIVLALLTFVISMGGQSASTFLVIQERSVLYSVVNLIQLIVGLTLNIVLVVYLRIGIIGIFISSLVSASIASLIFHWAAIRTHGIGYDKAIGRKLRQFWFPLIPGELFSYISRQAERFLVRFLINLEGVGILEMAYKFPPLLNLFIALPFQRAWRTKSLEIAPQPEAPAEISSMFTLYMFLMLFSAVLLAANIGTILTILTPPEFWEAASVARIEIATTVVAAANMYLVFGLIYRKQTWAITRIRIVTAGLKIALSAAFIALAGLRGAAYSALIMEIVVLVWIFIKAQRAYPLSLEYRKIAVLSTSAVVLVLAIDKLPLYAGGLLNHVERILFDNLTGFLASTPLGTWRSGKLIDLLNDRTFDFARLFVNCVFCLFYGGLVFVVKPDIAHFRESRLLRPLFGALRISKPT